MKYRIWKGYRYWHIEGYYGFWQGWRTIVAYNTPDEAIKALRILKEATN